MSGIKQFDEARALDGAMNVFWQNGFSATSYPELMEATGLNKSSLYNAFGDKQALYRDRKSTRLNSSHHAISRMPSSA